MSRRLHFGLTAVAMVVFDARAFGRVYLATNGRGIVDGELNVRESERR
jgi:hypothetical protein